MPSNLLTELYAAYKDWCIFNRFSPESARRFYGSIWEVSSQSKRTKATDAGCSRASGSSMKERQQTSTGRKGHKQGGNDFTKVPCLPKLDRISPSFEQGAKGAKGRFFQKTFSRPQSLSTVRKHARQQSTAHSPFICEAHDYHSNKGLINQCKAIMRCISLLHRWERARACPEPVEGLRVIPLPTKLGQLPCTV